MNNILLIGGGITSLYLAYKLSENRKYKITIIEKEDRLGGRIYSKYSNVAGQTLEFGAMRFSKSKHILIYDLCKDLSLSIKNFDYKHGEEIQYIKYVLQSLDNIPRENKEGKLFRDVVKTFMTEEQINYMCKISGYYSYLSDPQIGYDSVYEDLTSLICTDWFTITEGVQSLITTLYHIISERGVIVLRNVDYEIVKNKIRRNYDLIFDCRPYNTKYNMPMKKYEAAKVFLKTDSKIENVRKTFENGSIYYMKDGIVMYYILDGNVLRKLKYLNMEDKWLNINGNKDNNIKEIIDSIEDDIRCSVKFMVYKYWKNYITMWDKNPNIPYIKLSDKFYLVNNDYSKGQGWIEGSLDAINCLLSNENLNLSLNSKL
ncbi:NAD(P)-binding Rossmann-like domain-containing protein [Orpheovirus IHUMI-LCC2]|uniref:NAD(P)-binding Rossmann-like domain-containing protein n=1 Tax=Orpheovirus IHUMI-LCC2 TaxID=2023057 RepID=A0A2I2L3B3_9VIRU|nr:NAD(P)-binding Rossmann-like domain-containing protein [Orpheovirus IHUMI-LCC2]SNW62016.1 NAD(P)-binding Rossmann-like domain-containing protein [Orpheovirus IHUMI-LCC2]